MSASMPTPSSTFAGLDHANWGAGHPPDTVGDVGPNYYVQAVNTSIGIYDKTGGARSRRSRSTRSGRRHYGTARLRQQEPGRSDRRLRPDGRPVHRRRLRLDRRRHDAALLRVHRRLEDGRSRRRRLVALRLPDRRRRASVAPRLPEDGHLARRALHDREHVRLPTLPASRRRAPGRSTARDLESGAAAASASSSITVDGRTSACCPSNLRGAAAAGRTRRTFSSCESQTDFACEVWKFHVDWANPRLDVHRADERRPDAVHRRPERPCRAPANDLDTLADRLMMQNQYRTSTARSRSGSTTRSRTRRQPAERDPVGAGRRHRRHDRPTPVQQQIYGNLGATGSTASWGASPSTRTGNMALGYSVSNWR